MTWGAKRQRRFTRSISLNSESVRIAANCKGWSNAGEMPVVSRSNNAKFISLYRQFNWTGHADMQLAAPYTSDFDVCEHYMLFVTMEAK